MKRYLSLFLLTAAVAFAAAANDVYIQQRNAGNTGTAERTLAPTANGLFGFNASKLPAPVTVAGGLSLSGNVLTGTSGTVTSVSLALPNIFSVSGSPLTSSGTITATLANQNANLVFAGPASGGAGTPSFRTLVAADISGISGVYQPLNATLTAVAGGTYTGANSIAILGTITTGVWNATVIPANKGGAGTITGVLKANGSGTVSAATAGTDYLAPAAIGTTVQAYDADLAAFALKTAPSGAVVGTTDTQTLTNKSIAGSQLTGAYTAGGQTMATAKLLGRTTASTGAVEEITVGSGLTLSAGTLTAAGGAGLLASNNLSDVANAATAFGNIKQAATTSATGVVELATDGESGSSVVVVGNDSRLSNARTPSTHATSHASAGSDPITISQSQVTSLTSDLAGKQPLDAELTALAGLTSATDRIPYFTGTGTADITPFTAAARSLLDDSSSTAMRSTLGLIIGTNVQAWDTDLDSWATKTAPAGTVVGTTDVQALTNKSIDASANTITNIDITMTTGTLPVTRGGTNATSLTGVLFGNGTAAVTTAVAGTDYLDPTAIGTTVQAYDADLAAFALKTAPSGAVVGTTDTQTLTNKTIAGSQVTGAYTANGMTMATARLLGRTTASTGAAEEITVGTGLTFTGGSLSSLSPFTGTTGLTDNIILRSDGTGGGGIQGGGVVTLSDTGLFGFPAGVPQTFNPNASFVGLNVGSYAGVPGTLANGDLWYDSTATALKARINGATVSLGAGGGGGITGPGSSTDNALVRWDGTGGSATQDSNVTLADSGTALVFSGAAGLSASGTNQNVTLTPTGSGVTSIVGAATATGVVSGSGIAVTGSSPKIRYDYSGTNFDNALVFQPTTTNKDGRIILAPTGSSTESTMILQSNPSVDTTGSEVFQLGGGFSGAVSGSWNFGSTIYANASANSRPISFTVSNSTDGRIEAMRILNTGGIDVKRSIASTSTTTGALTVAGGVGVVGAAYIGGATNMAADIQANKTVTTAGTTGNQTINKNAGTVNFAAAATTLTVTNSRVTTSSIILVTIGTNDTTMKSVIAVAGSGSFVLTANAAATAETRVNFLVIN